MKKFTTSVLVISIAMMGTLSYNAAAKGPDKNRKGDGPRIENRNRPSGNHSGSAFHPGNKPGKKPGDRPAKVGKPSSGKHAMGHKPAPVHRPAVRPAHRPAPRPVPAPRHRHRSHASYRVARTIDRTAMIVSDIIAAAALNYAIGTIVSALPPYRTEVIVNGAPFYLVDNILYRPVVISGIPYFEIVNNRYF